MDAANGGIGAGPVRRHGAPATIVSNDRFRDGPKEFSDSDDRVIRYMILDGDVVLKRPDAPG